MAEAEQCVTVSVNCEIGDCEDGRPGPMRNQLKDFFQKLNMDLRKCLLCHKLV